MKRERILADLILELDQDGYTNKSHNSQQREVLSVEEDGPAPKVVLKGTDAQVKSAVRSRFLFTVRKEGKRFTEVPLPQL